MTAPPGVLHPDRFQLQAHCRCDGAASDRHPRVMIYKTAARALVAHLQDLPPGFFDQMLGDFNCRRCKKLVPFTLADLLAGILREN